MCEYANAQILKHVHTLTHEHACVLFTFLTLDIFDEFRGLRRCPIESGMTERPKNPRILEPFPFHLFAERSINGSGAAGCRNDGRTPSDRA